jgi:hypothetical protein
MRQDCEKFNRAICNLAIALHYLWAEIADLRFHSESERGPQKPFSSVSARNPRQFQKLPSLSMGQTSRLARQQRRATVQA